MQNEEEEGIGSRVQWGQMKAAYLTFPAIIQSEEGIMLCLASH